MQHNKADIMEWCQNAGCPTTAIYTIAEVAEQPHLLERGYIVDVEHPLLGKMRDIGAPFQLPECPGGPVAPPPLLGQHNDEVYGELLGMSSDDVTRLRDEDVI